MTTLRAPGVYPQRLDAGAATISPMRTDVAGFVGIATRGPVNVAVPVSSWRQFRSWFGSFTGAGYLAYAVRAFFENGGERCWVVRVASDAVATAGRRLVSGAGPVWSLRASSDGVWGNDLAVAVRETRRAQTLTRGTSPDPSATEVASVAGFARYSHVRLSQQGPGGVMTTVFGVVADVDAVAGSLLWRPRDPDLPFPYPAPVAGLDLTRPFLLESLEYTLQVWELGRLVGLYQDLSLVPEHPRYGPVLLPAYRVADKGFPGPAAGLAGSAPGQTAGLPAQPASALRSSAPAPLTIVELRGDPTAALEPLDGFEQPAPVPATLPLSPAVPLYGGAEGLARLTTVDFTGEEISPLDSDPVRARKRRGLQALRELPEVSMLAVPDIHIRPRPPAATAPPQCVPDPCLSDPSGGLGPATARPPAMGDLPPEFDEEAVYHVQAAMVQQCEDLRDRIALLDPPHGAASEDAFGIGAIRAWRSRFDTGYAALYFPWLRVVDPLPGATDLTRALPPSGHVAGQIARSDLTFGVHKAPANSPLAWAQNVTVTVDESVHGQLNALGINALRTFSGRGLRMFGARTVSSDADWRYLNVRRLLIFIARAVELSSQWAAFEPNDFRTRTKLHLALTTFLLTLWQQGALAGESAEEAFFVRCDEGNNPASERALGRLLADVGVAPVVPYEFVVLRVGRTDNEFTISETPLTGGGA